MSEILLELEGLGEQKIERLFKMEDMIFRYPYLVVAQTYDEIDAFCGVLAFIVHDVCSYYGILRKDQLSQQIHEDKIYKYRAKKRLYYESKL